ncbi:class I SAM-dependent DNA methyltransferase [Rhodococcus sp. NPDC060090]|uniref:class I SAM-dependent DNA methyltransferase n=1 Tax=Rhodococcus sp. NPDC060090 TaxID=3347056 RepID=UPI00365122F9
MTENRLLDLVDHRDFRTLFIDELGWNNPDRPDLSVEVDDETFTLHEVAGYKGLRIWHCPVLPPRKTQRQIDVLVGRDNQERLVIFTNEHKQEWRWPRRAQLGSANAKLLVHEHIVGDRSTHLTQRLQAIELDFDEDISLVALLDKMRDAFDHEAETASVAAARLMGALYTELEACGVGEHDATLLLARLLFLLFGDDADMWKPEGLFEKYVREQTTADSLRTDLQALFDVLDTEEQKRDLPADSPYAPFRYINGGLFKDAVRLPHLNSAFRDALLKACEFDWSIISPAVFGSMFQTVKSKEARRTGGEHYTTEENILKTIRPLFLDEYRDRFERAKDDKAHLTKLHNELGRLRFLDPACGCGNFLIVAYRELRALELEILQHRRDLDMSEAASRKVQRAQLSLDVTGDIKVTLDHFYGIELEEWPARIAETAMLLVDHLANQNMAQEFGVSPDRLPIRIAPNIKHGNALQIIWERLLPPSNDVIIFGNPPFSGQHRKTPEQTADAKAVWGNRYSGYLDYVTCWYAKTIDYYQQLDARWAFVSTNSICQGEPVEFLWRPILESGWRCRFAHRTLLWSTESKDGAAVHVSILGFDRRKTPRPILWHYGEGGKSKGTSTEVVRINPYLVDGPNVLVSNRSTPLSLSLTSAGYGSKPTDGGNLVVTPEEFDTVSSDPIAARYLKRFIGARELLHDTARWCLWLVDATDGDVADSPVLSERVTAVKSFRESSKKVATRRKASTPHLFDERRHNNIRSLGIPEVSSERRRYLPTRLLSEDEVASNKVYRVTDPDGFTLGILSSSMFMTWMKTVGGRLKSDLSFSNTFTYNNFPLPEVSKKERREIASAAASIMQVRESYPEWSLARLYDPAAMPADLLDAHRFLDEIVDSLFGIKKTNSLEERQKALFRFYAKMTGLEPST